MPDKVAGRITEVDTARGLAVAMMIAYHIIFDLDYLGLASIDLSALPLLLFQRIIGTMFILIAGISLTLSESRNREGYAHHAKRGLKLAAVALLITLATWVYPHDGFIQFGIIHLIALSTFLAPFFFRLGWLNVPLGLVLIAAGAYAGTMTMDSHYLFWLGITDPGYHALDHYPLLPWFGVILIGVWVGQALFPQGRMALRAAGALAFLGRHSLAIYLIHQPVIIAAMLAYRQIS